MEINSDLVRKENIKVSAAEAKDYDILHPEVWNWDEQNRCLRLVKKTLQLISDRKEPVIVDVGAGTGNLTMKYLAKGSRVISIDISREMLDVLEGKLTMAQKEKSTIICSDIESSLKQLPSIDGCCFCSVLHHIYDYKDVIQKLVNKMSSDAFLFIIHDPLIQEPRSETVYKLHKFLGMIDEKLYHYNLERKGLRLKDLPDDSIAEFHQRAGTMNHIELIKFLEQIGMVIEHFETYVSRRYGFFAWLSTNIIGSENCFTLIAKKQK